MENAAKFHKLRITTSQRLKLFVITIANEKCHRL